MALAGREALTLLYRRLLFFLIALGVGGVIDGCHNSRLRVGYAEAPRVVTPAELAASAPEDNRHVRLTGFRLNLDQTVYMVRKGNAEWTTVYVPVGMFTAATQVQILVTSKKVPSEEALRELGRRIELEGMVVNGVTDLDEKAQKLLAEHFTGTDFSRVWLLDVDQTSVASPFPPTFGGVVLLSFAGFLLWRNRS